MKVLWLIDTLEVGGAERSLLEMGRHLRQVTPVVCHLYPGAALAPLYRQAGIEVTSLDLPGRYSPLSAVRGIVEVARRVRPDLLHSTLMRTGLWARGAAARTGLPLVHSWVNEPSAASGRGGPPGWRRRTVHLADRLTCGRVDRFVANSAELARLHAAALGVDERRIEVIYRGRDPQSLLPPPAGELTALRHELGIGDGQAVLLNVARLRPQKAQDVLLRAFAEVARRRPGARLLLAGDGPERKSLARLAEELGVAGSVRLLGQRADVPALLAVADLFVFPSRREGHPGALVEAMLAGRAIVASDLPVHRETVEDGRSALLVASDDPGALARAVEELLEDPRRRAALGAAAQRDAEERFDVRRAAAAHEQLYAEVVAARRRREA